MKDHDAYQIRKAINTSEIFKLPKSKLEHFAANLATANAYSYFGVREFERISKTVKLALQNTLMQESANKISSTKNNKHWYNKPIGITFLAAMGAVLGAAVLYVIYHYFGLQLNK